MFGLRGVFEFGVVLEGGFGAIDLVAVGALSYFKSYLLVALQLFETAPVLLLRPALVLVVRGMVQAFGLREEAHALLEKGESAAEFEQEVLVVGGGELVLGELEGVDFGFCVGGGVPK